MSKTTDNTIENLGSALLTLATGQTKLLSLEAALAKHSIIPLIASMIGTMILTVSSWLLILCLLIIGVHALTDHWALSVIIMLFFNLGLGLLMLRCVNQYSKRITFEKTRAHVKQWLGDLS